jgi:hypothetical protein
VFLSLIASMEVGQASFRGFKMVINAARATTPAPCAAELALPARVAACTGGPRRLRCNPSHQAVHHVRRRCRAAAAAPQASGSSSDEHLLLLRLSALVAQLEQGVPCGCRMPGAPPHPRCAPRVEAAHQLSELLRSSGAHLDLARAASCPTTGAGPLLTALARAMQAAASGTAPGHGDCRNCGPLLLAGEAAARAAAVLIGAEMQPDALAASAAAPALLGLIHEWAPAAETASLMQWGLGDPHACDDAAGCADALPRGARAAAAGPARGAAAWAALALARWMDHPDPLTARYAREAVAADGVEAGLVLLLESTDCPGAAGAAAAAIAGLARAQCQAPGFVQRVLVSAGAVPPLVALLGRPAAVKREPKQGGCCERGFSKGSGLGRYCRASLPAGLPSAAAAAAAAALGGITAVASGREAFAGVGGPRALAGLLADTRASNPLCDDRGGARSAQHQGHMPSSHPANDGQHEDEDGEAGLGQRGWQDPAGPAGAAVLGAVQIIRHLALGSAASFRERLLVSGALEELAALQMAASRGGDGARGGGGGGGGEGEGEVVAAVNALLADLQAEGVPMA